MDVGLDEPLPLLSLELPGASTSVVYTEHLIDGSHYLFLGTGGGRLLQVRSRVRNMTLCSHYLFLGTGVGDCFRNTCMKCRIHPYFIVYAGSIVWLIMCWFTIANSTVATLILVVVSV